MNNFLHIPILSHSVVSDSLHPIDCSLPGSSSHGISQARVLEWIAITFSRGPSWPRNQTCMSCISCIGRQILYHWATWEALGIPNWAYCFLSLYSLSFLRAQLWEWSRWLLHGILCFLPEFLQGSPAGGDCNCWWPWLTWLRDWPQAQSVLM